jgi:hypothetical protein
MVPYLISDPSVGLYSPTDTSKGGVLNQKVEVAEAFGSPIDSTFRFHGPCKSG